MNNKSSFSKKTKNELISIKIKKNCCKKAFIFGIFCSNDCLQDNKCFFKTDSNDLFVYFVNLLFESYSGFKSRNTLYTICTSGETFSITLSGEFSKIVYNEYSKNEFCKTCFSTFLRGLFCGCGTISKPQSCYNLELYLKNIEIRDYVIGLINSKITSLKFFIRDTKDYHNIIIKDSDSIQDFLNYICAISSSFEIINAKIYKNIRNNANRQANCVTANINKSVVASRNQIDCIKEFIKINRDGSLISKELQETIDLRIKNPEISLQELADLHNPPVSKSCVYHRISKIMKLINMK